MVKDDMFYCIQCGGKIKKDSDRCEHCGALFGKPLSEIKRELNEENVDNNIHNKIKYSNVQSIGRLTLFMVVTAGFYEFYWFYRNWKDLKAHKNLNIHVKLRTLAMFVPIVDLFFAGSQFKNINDYARESGVKIYSFWFVFLLWAIFEYMSNVLGFFDGITMDIVSWILTFAVVIPLIMAQKTLNSYWEKEQGNLPKRRISYGEILVLIFGILLTIIGLFGS